MHKTFTEISALPPVVFHEDVYLVTGAGAVFAKRECSERKLKNIDIKIDELYAYRKGNTSPLMRSRGYGSPNGPILKKTKRNEDIKEKKGADNNAKYCKFTRKGAAGNRARESEGL